MCRVRQATAGPREDSGRGSQEPPSCSKEPWWGRVRPPPGCLSEGLTGHSPEMASSWLRPHNSLEPEEDPCGSVVKNLRAVLGDPDSISGSGRSPAGGNGNPLQYSCLENPRTEEPGGLQSTWSQRVRHDSNYQFSLSLKT